MAKLIAFLIQHFQDFDTCTPDGDLSRLLEAEGFARQEIAQIMLLVQVLKEEVVWYSDAPGCRAMRLYWPQEEEMLPTEVRGLLHFLQTAGALNDVQREFVIHALFNLPAEDLNVDLTRLITLLVLWAQKSELPVWAGVDLIKALHADAPVH